MHFRADLDELGSNTNAVAVAADASFEEVIGGQLPADLAGALAGTLEQHRRGARDDAEARGAESTDLRDHFLGQAIAEIFLGRIVAQICEREHDEPQAHAVRRFRRLWPHDVQIADRLPFTLDGSDEAVAPPVQGLDEPRIVRVIAERCAQPLNRGVQAVLEIDERPFRPETLAKFFARYDFTRALQHDRRESQRAGPAA